METPQSMQEDAEKATNIRPSTEISIRTFNISAVKDINHSTPVAGRNMSQVLLSVFMHPQVSMFLCRHKAIEVSPGSTCIVVRGTGPVHIRDQ
jgi:hypothetical protein